MAKDIRKTHSGVAFQGGNMARKSLLLLLAAVLILPLSAGGSAEADDGTVVIWHSNSGVIGNAFDDIVERFNSTIGAEKGITIEAIYQGSANDVLTKVKAAAAVSTSTLPDIAQLDATAALDMKNSDYLILPSDLGIDTSSIMPSAIESLSSERGLLAIPFNASSLLFYYNKAVFDEAGVNPPRTLDEFAAIAPLVGEKGSDGSVTRYAFSGVPATYELGAFIGAQKGLSYMVDGENGHNGIPRSVLFGKEGTFRNFLVHWKKLYDTGFVSSITSGISTEFAAGRTASMLASSSNLSTVLSTVDGRFEVGTAFVPMTDEEATGGVNIGGGAMFSFSSGDAVKTVLDYLVSEETQLEWAEKTGYMPVNTGLYDDPDYIAFLDDNPLFRVAMEQTEASNPKVTGVWLPSAYQIYYSFQSEIRNVTENGKDIDKAVEDMEAAVQKALDDYAEQNIL